MKELSIIQITDTHLTADESPFRGFSVCENFEMILDKISRLKCDLLVLSGDLAAIHGEKETYSWIKSQLKNLKFETLFLAGNHDDPGMMNQIFQLDEFFIDGFLYGKWDSPLTPIYFLDTSQNVLPQKQLDWLMKECQKDKRSSLLFMHHPPVHCDCLYMDTKYPLKNREKIWPRLKEINNIQHIFVGHYHTEKTIFYDQKYIHITPSSAMQIRQDRLEYQVLHSRPGFRKIELSQNDLTSYVEYL